MVAPLSHCVDRVCALVPLQRPDGLLLCSIFVQVSTTFTGFELGIIFCSLQKLWQHLPFLYRFLECPSDLLAFRRGSH
jgi:hypothetical protein